MTYIEIGDWPLMQTAAQAVRTAVFVQEQGIAPEDEWDTDDATALHAVLFDVNGQALGNAACYSHLPMWPKLGAWRCCKKFEDEAMARVCYTP